MRKRFTCLVPWPSTRPYLPQYNRITVHIECLGHPLFDLGTAQCFGRHPQQGPHTCNTIQNASTCGANKLILLEKVHSSTGSTKIKNQKSKEHINMRVIKDYVASKGANNPGSKSADTTGVACGHDESHSQIHFTGKTVRSRAHEDTRREEGRRYLSTMSFRTAHYHYHPQSPPLCDHCRRQRPRALSALAVALVCPTSSRASSQRFCPCQSLQLCLDASRQETHCPPLSLCGSLLGHANI